ncbi:MAG: spiro-SPASM protein [Spirochaetaceae bacterium]|nr:spiro-SPASM protein [Spirochaetaceae bacterium]
MNTGYNAAVVLFAGDLHEEAFEKAFDGKSALDLALKRAAAFPYAVKITVLAPNDFDETLIPGYVERIELVRGDSWNTKTLLHSLARAGEGFDLSYFSWMDTPFLDVGLAGDLAGRHLRGVAEYSYADGWPGGLAPEILSPGTAGILARINGDNEAPVERDTIFAVLQKDINTFDIETEISQIDFSRHRLNLAACSRRNLLLLKRFWDAGVAGTVNTTDAAGRIIVERPGLLRSLPAFYPIQVVSACPQRCRVCPYPKSGVFRFLDFLGGETPIKNDSPVLKPEDFSVLLDKIEDFSGDGVVDLSLWGELALHPQKFELVRDILRRPALSLVIETSGIGWETSDFETLARESAAAPPRKNRMAALSWIVSLDSNDESGYRKVRDEGFGTALENARSIISLFPKDAYVQALRMKGNETEIEKFYRFWKDEKANVIIQKYDSFCGILPERSAADLSPIKRDPCWHLMRDMPILLDGSVPACRSARMPGDPGTAELPASLGNALDEDLDTIWRRGESVYERHCAGNYGGHCSKCDEYYTFNF